MDDSMRSTKKMSPVYSVTHSLILLACVIVWSVLINIPIRVNGLDGSSASGVVFSVLAFFPLPVVAYIIFTRLLKPMFDEDPSNDENANPVAYVITYASFCFAWALIYEFFWLQDPDTCENLALQDNAYLAWGFFIGGAFFRGFGTAPEHALATRALVTVIAAFQLMLGWINNAILIAWMLDVYKTFRNKRFQSTAKKTDKPPTPVSANLAQYPTPISPSGHPPKSFRFPGASV
jgi:hypothetical protein